MKGRKYRLYIEDILESIRKIERYIENLDYKEFEKNELIVDAVIRNLEIIGEASRNIANNIRNKYTDIPWKRTIGLRNIATHEYFGIDLSIIWEIITVNLPETKPKIELMVKDFS
jgi:uncharacterized protein with HEPN domain